MTIDLTIISLLESKDEIDSSAAQLILGKTEVPGAYLEEMEAVLGNLLRWHGFVHELVHGLHLPDTISVFLHVAIVLEVIHVQEFVLGCIIFEGLRDFVITIADTYYNDILLSHGDLFVIVHDVVVLDDTFESGL